MACIYFAGGCLWGVQHFFNDIPGVIHTEAGRINGRTQTLDPPYDGYAEGVKITFDAKQLTLINLLDYLFEIIDPYSLNQQGNDKGEKYRTGIYSNQASDLVLARRFIAEQPRSSEIKVEVLPLKNYIPSAEEHQHHLEKYPEDYYLCHLPLQLLNKYRNTNETV